MPDVSFSRARRWRCRPVGRAPTRWHRALGTPVLVAGHRCPYLVASQAIPAHRQAPHARARRLPCLWTDQEGRSCLRAPSPSPHAAAVAAGFLRTQVHGDGISGDGRSGCRDEILTQCQTHDTRTMSCHHTFCSQQGQNSGPTGVVDATLTSAHTAAVDGSMSLVGCAHDDDP